MLLLQAMCRCSLDILTCHQSCHCFQYTVYLLEKLMTGKNLLTQKAWLLPKLGEELLWCVKPTCTVKLSDKHLTADMGLA